MKAIEEIKRIYDTPGRQWEKGAMRGAHNPKSVAKTRQSNFDDMLREALLLGEQITIIDSRRAALK